jgi:hypothetical protein
VCTTRKYVQQIKQNGGLLFNFGHAPFFVSPARHGEAQELSGDLKQTKQTQNKRQQQQRTQTATNNKMNTVSLPLLPASAPSLL